MQTDELILAEEFCSHYSINVSFVETLNELGLIQVVSLEHKPYIHHDELNRLEQLLRLHADLDINPEGIDVVCNLLDKMKAMQTEMAMLKSRLRLYEG